ncbi:MAG: endonuclease/exonuclease/phosphatase family protein [Aggregatilineales bacterium]
MTCRLVARRVFIFIALLYAAALIALLVSWAAGVDWWWLALLRNLMPFWFLPLALLIPLLAALRSKALLPLVALALFGIVSFGRHYLPRPVVETSAETLSVVTFNLSSGNRQPAMLIDWLLRHQPDLVFLQEIPPSWHAEIGHRLDELYPFQLTHTVVPEFQRAALLARHPLVAQQNDYSFFRALMIYQGQPIAVYNISLPAPISLEPRQRLHFVHPIINPLWDMALSYNETLRDLHLQRLLDQIDTEVFPMIVAGDFNMSEFTPGYDQLAERLLDSYREAGVGLGATWPNVRRFDLPAIIPVAVRIDYIWHSRDLRALAAQRGDYWGSDHLAVLAELSPPAAR